MGLDYAIDVFFACSILLRWTMKDLSDDMSQGLAPVLDSHCISELYRKSRWLTIDLWAAAPLELEAPPFNADAMLAYAEDLQCQPVADAETPKPPRSPSSGGGPGSGVFAQRGSGVTVQCSRGRGCAGGFRDRDRRRHISFL